MLCGRCNQRPLFFLISLFYYIAMPALLKEKIIFKNGKPEAVILDIKKYQQLLEIAEDKEDLAELHRIKRSKTSFKDLKDYLKNSV